MTCEDNGVAASQPGCQPTASTADAFSQSGIPNAYWLIWASQGEYSDRSEWPLVLCSTKGEAEAVVIELDRLQRGLAVTFTAMDGGWDDSDKLYEGTPDGLRYMELSGGDKPDLHRYDRHVYYTCSEVPILPASAIEARSDETHGGSAVGESAIPEGETPND